MPSFDIVSEVDKQELDNAVNQTRKELATRFDFKGIITEILFEKDKITLTAQDAGHLRGLREILIGKLSKRGLAQYRTGRARNFIRWACPAGIKDSTGAGRKQSKGNYSGDQVTRFQGAKPTAGSADSSDRKEEG